MASHRGRRHHSLRARARSQGADRHPDRASHRCRGRGSVSPRRRPLTESLRVRGARRARRHAKGARTLRRGTIRHGPRERVRLRRRSAGDGAARVPLLRRAPGGGWPGRPVVDHHRPIPRRTRLRRRADRISTESRLPISRTIRTSGRCATNSSSHRARADGTGRRAARGVSPARRTAGRRATL